ncbi:PDR/VanB family oxidoreductase [Nocardioides sp. NPDC051685]|uniref:PDR/VanB family oxidoreductase n=1 Tax=Nocardioides sp. NPDC051685 TaxID=3364334 RepID=UPI0037BD266A
MSEVAVMLTDTTSLAEDTLVLEVADREALAPDIVSLTLRSPQGEELPAWTPGSHIDLILGNGLTRQYSLCGGLDDRKTWKVGILRDADSRGGSSYVHDELQVGDMIGVAGPRNHFPLEPSSRYVFVAGGIGVTPLIPMLEAAQRAAADWTLIYCARSREAMGYLPELQKRFGDHLIVNADDESGLFDLPGYFAEVQPDTMVYACGPTPFLDATTAATAGWPAGTVHFERFSPLEFDDAVNVDFEVELAHSGKILPVPADRSILSVLREEGVRVLSSCTEGTCGTCEVAVLGGQIDHRDAVLSPEEQETGEMMMVCVSRCLGGRLTLDL